MSRISYICMVQLAADRMLVYLLELLPQFEQEGVYKCRPNKGLQCGFVHVRLVQGLYNWKKNEV